MLKLATITTTTGYVKLANALNAGFGTAKTLYNGAFEVPADAAAPVRVSITQGAATTGVDALSKLIQPGGIVSFDDVDLNNVWIKSSVASTIEVNGDVTG